MVLGLGYGSQGMGFRVKSSGFGIQGLGGKGSGVRVEINGKSLRFRVRVKDLEDWRCRGSGGQNVKCRNKDSEYVYTDKILDTILQVKGSKVT